MNRLTFPGDGVCVSTVVARARIQNTCDCSKHRVCRTIHRCTTMCPWSVYPCPRNWCCKQVVVTSPPRTAPPLRPLSFLLEPIHQQHCEQGLHAFAPRHLCSGPPYRHATELFDSCSWSSVSDRFVVSSPPHLSAEVLKRARPRLVATCNECKCVLTFDGISW